jgi:heme O synthase-like polyprenyltransferase
VTVAAATSTSFRQAVTDYVSLTKPGIVGLLDATALASMVAAGHGRLHGGRPPR